MRASLCVAIVAVMASCAPSEDAGAVEVCDAYCECTSLTRFDHERCFESCLAELDGDPRWCTAYADTVDGMSCFALEACVGWYFDLGEYGPGRRAIEE